MKFLLRAFLVLALLTLGLVAFAYRFYERLLTPAQSQGKAQIFQVAAGMSGSDVAQALVRQGLIRDELSFRLLLRYHPQGKDIKVGTFQLSPGSTPMEIFAQLQVAKDLTQRATFPEGLVITQVAQVAKRSGLIGDEAKFCHLARTQGKSFGEGFPGDLEGYLLPDTYEFPLQCDETAVLKRLTDEFRTRVEPLWAQYRAKSALKSLHQVIILASLVERESQVDSERPLIAGVYLNRIRQGMRLECDATIQYALGQQKPILTFEDLKIESPYNTYKIEGLPPGPIANPGLRSIQAALQPQASKFFFYVRNDIKNDGSHVFSQTYQEHLANCSRYQK